MTELWREFEVADRLEAHRNAQALMTGWFAAGYVWRKELPPLATELAKIRRKPHRRQTAAEALMVLESISARLGIPIQTRKAKQ